MDPQPADDWTLLALGVLYLLPAIVALLRRHQSVGAILVLTVLLGWTLLGWVAALIWSLTGVWRPEAR